MIGLEQGSDEQEGGNFVEDVDAEGDESEDDDNAPPRAANEDEPQPLPPPPNDIELNNDDEEAYVPIPREKVGHDVFNWFWKENRNKYYGDDYADVRPALLLNAILFLFDVALVPIALFVLVFRGRFLCESWRERVYLLEEATDENLEKYEEGRGYLDEVFEMIDYDWDLRVFLIYNFFIFFVGLCCVLPSSSSVWFVYRANLQLGFV